MLSVRRDPILDNGTHISLVSPNGGGQAASRATGFTRFVAGVQILGTLLAIPVGLASGYSIYRANFSPEAHCGTLRANIISMLDKKADASTLRLLVRRDVATFERSCASVDPDAVAAFRTLLVKPVTVAATASPEQKRLSVEHATPAQRPEPAKAVTRATEAKAKPATKAKPARSNSDADWLAAVRRALVEHGPVTHAMATEAPLPLPVTRSTTAPPLRSTTSVAGAPARPVADDHPVPPAPIPNVGPQ